MTTLTRSVSLCGTTSSVERRNGVDRQTKLARSGALEMHVDDELPGMNPPGEHEPVP